MLIQFFYHNHGFEFAPYKDGTLFDLLVQKTDPDLVKFEMDVLWTIHPGQDPVALLKKYPNRWALMHERREEPEPTLNELLGHLSPCDLVLIEGVKQEPVPKLEVYRPENGKPPLFPERSDIVAIATDVDLATDLPQLPLNDYVAIADFVMHTMQLQERPC